MLKLGSKIFDFIFSEENRKKIEGFTIWTATIGFIFHLSLVILNNNSIINMGNESLLLTNPISAIYTPFSIILYYEIFLLIFYLPRSFTTSILKQFEIISLIIIRRIFYDIPKLDLESNNWFENADNLQITYDLICILILFFLIYLFNYVKSNIDIKKTKNIDKFIDSKKIISVLLIPVMIVLFIIGLYNWYSIGISTNFASSFYYVNEVFYNTFFSILIIADVFILLLSFLYTERYSQIMRNTGFIICTILIRLSFSSTGLTNLLLIISSLYFLALSLIICFEKISINLNPSSTSKKDILYKFISVFKSLKTTILNAFKDINLKLSLLHNALFIESSPGPVKYAASLLNLCREDTRLPLSEITEKTKNIIKSTLKELNLI